MVAFDVNFNFVWSDLTWSYSLSLVTRYPSRVLSEYHAIHPFGDWTTAPAVFHVLSSLLVVDCGLALEALADKAVALVQLIQHFEPFFGRLEGGSIYFDMTSPIYYGAREFA